MKLNTMSGAASGSQATTKATVSDSKDESKPLQPQKPAAQLEEDDEFEDFPVEGTLYLGINTRYLGRADKSSRLGERRGSRRTSKQHASMGGELG